MQALRASGKTVSCIVRETGISRNRVIAWAGLVELPERNQMEPNPRTPAFYQEHLAKRWAEGFQHGRRLLKEIQELGYTGSFSYPARFLGRWRTPPTPVVSVTMMPAANVPPLVPATNSLLLCRQISPFGGGCVTWQTPIPDHRRAVQTGLALMKLGIQDFSGLAPREVFTWSALLTLKGFVSVGGS